MATNGGNQGISNMYQAYLVANTVTQITQGTYVSQKAAEDAAKKLSRRRAGRFSITHWDGDIRRSEIASYERGEKV